MSQTTKRALEASLKKLLLEKPLNKITINEDVYKRQIQYDAFVVTDEVYEHIIYAPAEHICMASLPGMFEHTITCNSLSETYSITGWRLGYLIGPAEVIEGARKVHDLSLIHI